MRGKSTDIPIIRSAAFEEQCASSAGGRVANGEVRARADAGGRHKNYNFPFHCIEWPQRQPQLTHHNKRITPRLAHIRAHCKQCVSGIPSLFMPEHIPEGFLLFVHGLFVQFFCHLGNPSTTYVLNGIILKILNGP